MICGTLSWKILFYTLNDAQNDHKSELHFEHFLIKASRIFLNHNQSKNRN